MESIIDHLQQKLPCSVVSIGATEAFVMAQYTVYNEGEIERHPETLIANQGLKAGFFHRGVRLPNISARNDLIQAARLADVVGYNTVVESARQLTEKVFAAYDVHPSHIFEANLRRVIMFSQREQFLKMMAGKKIILIGSQANQAQKVLERTWQTVPPFQIAGAIPIYEYEEIPWVQQSLLLYDFDLALLSAGINAVILAAYIANTLGKVAFDIGWGMQSLISGEVVIDDWINEEIGLRNLYAM